ncbi:MAG TPA: carbohydrate kinase, partial [Bacteroidales bacterium]|nr:carbohydrate kinase [Bacteroidales bacterium]
MPEKVILVFDIGKTMKKFLLFDRQMKVVLEEEKSFATIKDEDGFE